MEFAKLLRESQFHGGRRLAEGKYRGVWAITMLILFGTSLIVICVTVNRFLDNPTYLVKMESVKANIEFPSVVVCPEVLFQEEAVDNFLAEVQIPPNMNVSYLKAVLHTIGAFFSPDIVYKLQDLQNIEQLLEYNNMDVNTAGRMLTTSCDNTFIRCRWQGVIMNCSSLFQMELTGDGYCCVFNGRSLRRKENSEYSFDGDRKWYTNTFGFTSGLMIAVNQSQKLYNVDITYKWVALQNSRQFVEPTINGTPINPGEEHWFEYHMRNFQINEDARGLSNRLRRCRLTKEPLEYFPEYQKAYCIVECEVIQALKRCNCVRLALPHPRGIPRCRANSLACAYHAMVSYDTTLCDCPQACDVATSFVKSSSFTMMSEARPIDTFYEGLDISKVSVVRAFIFNHEVLTYSRNSYFNNIELFSQMGGVFNVFFGCSILTIMELAILGARALSSAQKTANKVKFIKNDFEKSEDKPKMSKKT